MDRNFIDQFIQEILTEAGLNFDGSPELRDTFLHLFSYELRRRIGIFAVRELDAASFRDFQKLVRNNPNQDLLNVIDFLRARLPNFTEITAKAIFDFKCEIIEKARELKANAATQVV
jgi:hypothetical protein